MRHLIHEQSYERPLLAGQLRYERDGRPTGAVESWRLTAAVDGYRFLRVDLDGRASSGRSWLYHLTLAPDGRPEQLKARHWAAGVQAEATVLWHDGEWVSTRTVTGAVGQAASEEVASGVAFWFPAGAGLALLRDHVGATTGVTLATGDDPARLLALVETPVELAWGEVDTVMVDGAALPAWPLSLRWSGGQRLVWLDDDARPLRLWRDDNLTATAERLVLYR
jgi:hypothetical protein